MQTISSMNTMCVTCRSITISIGLLSTLLLASCGGGGSTEQKATAQSADESIKRIQAVSGSATVPATWTGHAPIPSFESTPNRNFRTYDPVINSRQTHFGKIVNGELRVYLKNSSDLTRLNDWCASVGSSIVYVGTSVLNDVTIQTNASSLDSLNALKDLLKQNVWISSVGLNEIHDGNGP